MVNFRAVKSLLLAPVLSSMNTFHNVVSGVSKICFFIYITCRFTPSRLFSVFPNKVFLACLDTYLRVIPPLHLTLLELVA